MSHLKFIKYKNLKLWDIKRIHSKLFDSKYSIEEMGSLIKIKNKKEPIHTEIDKNFGILGVNNRTGIFDNIIENSEKINQPYYKMENGDIAYNPYRINVGSIGVKKEEHKNKYISPAYVVFTPSKKVLAEYIFLIFKTSTFNKYINNLTTGSVRQNLSKEILKKMQIPFPPMENQIKFVDEYKTKEKLAYKQEKEAEELEKSIEDFLVEELGIETLENKKNEKGLIIIDYKVLERWDYLSQDLNINLKLKKSKYIVKKMGEIYNFVKKTWKKNEFINSEFNYIEISSVDPLLGIINTEKVEVKKAPSRATQIVNTGDLIIATTRPYLKKFAIVTDKNDNDVCSSGFCVLSKSDEYNLKYLKEFLMTEFGLEQLKGKMTGALYPTITIKELKEIEIPLPPLETQNKIVKVIEEKKEKIKWLKEQAEFNRKTAIEEFEKEIFQDEN